MELLIYIHSIEDQLVFIIVRSDRGTTTTGHVSSNFNLLTFWNYCNFWIDFVAKWSVGSGSGVRRPPPNWMTIIQILSATPPVNKLFNNQFIYPFFLHFVAKRTVGQGPGIWDPPPSWKTTSGHIRWFVDSLQHVNKLFNNQFTVFTQFLLHFAEERTVSPGPGICNTPSSWTTTSGYIRWLAPTC